MTNEKLEQKIQEIEEKLSGIAKMVEPYKGATWGLHWSAEIEDINYIETLDYQVAATRWNEHHWNEGGGGVKWTDWISVYYKRRGTEEVKTLKTDKVVTRDQYDPKKDLTDLWGYNEVGLKHIQANIIKVVWTNKEGHESSLARYIDLDTK